MDGFESRLLTLGIFVDFSKAFDRLNHATLLTKLERYGIRGAALNLIRSYLQSRSQCVVINKAHSDFLPINAGVPQGSILGPLLFNLYVNDITKINPEAKFVIYADDTSLFLAANTTEELTRMANSTLEKLHEWSIANSLVINVLKTKSVVFRTRNTLLRNPPNLLIGDTNIPCVPNVKTLGVICNENLYILGSTY